MSKMRFMVQITHDHQTSRTQRRRMGMWMWPSVSHAMERLPDYQGNMRTRISFWPHTENIATLQGISQTQQAELNPTMPFQCVLCWFKSSPAIQISIIEPPKPASTLTFPHRVSGIPLFLKHNDPITLQETQNPCVVSVWKSSYKTGKRP